MSIAGPLDHLPLWVLLGATIVVLLLFVEVGYRLGGYRRRRSEQEKEGPVGAMVAATIGLLAFMLAFTFGLSASRFEARKQMVVEEANAIGTTFLRAGLLPGDRGAKVRELLREYADTRLEAARVGNVEQVLRRSEALHRELWREAEVAGGEHPESIVVGLFLQSLNETIDLHATRARVAIRSRIPGAIWGTLYLVTLLTMAAIGYHGGLAGTSRSPAVLLLAVNLSIILMLIADLDRPQEGVLKVSQQAMIDLRRTMSD
jgi:hypothetical protein